MAKKEKSELTQAREELREAQQAYGRLARLDTRALTGQQVQKHRQEALKALEAKQAAAVVVQALELGKKPPAKRE